MNLPALLSVLGLLSYGALFILIAASPPATEERVRRLFLVSLVVMMAWQISALAVSLTRRDHVAAVGYQAMSTIVPVFGITYARFVRAFLGMKTRGLCLLGGGVLCIGILAIILVSGTGFIEDVYWNRATHFYIPEFGPLLPVVGIPYGLILSYVAILLLRGYPRVQHPPVRHQIQFLLLGWCIVVLGTLTNLVPLLKAYPIDLLANLINAVLIVHAIFRYRFLDVSFVLRQGLAYSIHTTVIAIGYFLTVLVVEKLFRGFMGYQAFLISLLVAAVTAVATHPLREHIQRWVDRLFFRDRYDTQRMLQELSGLATSILDIDQLAAMLLDRLAQTMHVRRAGLALREPAGTRFHLIAEMGLDQQEHPDTFDLDPPLVQWIAEWKAVITRSDLDALPQLEALSAQIRAEIEDSDAQLFVPIIAQGTLIGLLILGHKRAETCYSQNEQRTLVTLANQVAIAVENARLFAEAQAEIAERKRAQLALQDRETMLHRRTARLELLREIDEAILEARDLNAIVETALSRTRELLDCEGAGLMTLGADIYDIVAMVSDTEVVQTPITPEGSGHQNLEIFRKLQEGEACVVHDLETAPYPQMLNRNLRALGYRSMMLVPILHRQPDLVETLTLMADRPGAFGDEERAIGKDVAHSLALVIRHAEMRREIQARTEALEQQLARVHLFNEITRAIVSRYDLDSILRVVAQRLEDDFADMAAIWLGDGNIFNAREANHPTCATGSHLLYQMVIPVELPELQALRDGKVVYLSDMTRTEVPSLRRVEERLQMRSAVVVPLVVDGTVFGVVVSARREPEAFSHAERTFLGGLGEHVALAIHQARLHKEVAAAYQELRKTQRTAMQQERLRALGEMASGIAHDINNAISPIPLYIRLVESKCDLTEATAAHLNTIKIAVKDVEETVRRMRQFYRIREAQERRPVNLNRATQQAIELTRPRWRDVPQEQGITINLQTDFQADLPLVMGDEAEIRQAVTNLILNAIDAMPEGGTMILRTRERTDPSDGVRLDVIDTGIGMDEEQKARAFEPFFSNKGSRGSGLGLATVYGTMQRHGGTAEVESAVGEGTTMRLTFPHRPVIVDRTAHEALSPPSPLRILCVDDEPLVRKALKEVLASEGHTVTVTDGGIAGLDAFRTALHANAPFDVVITDLGMPDIDGRRVAEEIKEASPQTPVIMLTGWGYRLQAEDDVPPGVDRILSKPPTIEALVRALAQVTSG